MTADNAFTNHRFAHILSPIYHQPLRISPSTDNILHPLGLLASELEPSLPYSNLPTTLYCPFCTASLLFPCLPVERAISI